VVVFGACTTNPVDNKAFDKIQNQLIKSDYLRFGIEPLDYLVEISVGAQVVK